MEQNNCPCLMEVSSLSGSLTSKKHRQVMLREQRKKKLNRPQCVEKSLMVLESGSGKSPLTLFLNPFLMA